MKNKTTLTKLKKIVDKAYNQAFFYRGLKVDHDIKDFNDFENLPTIQLNDIRKERLSLYARGISEVNYQVSYYRAISKQEMDYLVDVWNKRLENSKVVLPLFDKDLQLYCQIFDNCKKFVYPKTDYTLSKLVNIIIDNDIDTIVASDKNAIKLAQYVYNNNILFKSKVIVLFEHYNQDLVTRVNRCLNQDVLCIKIDSEMMFEIGEVKDNIIRLNTLNYYEIVDSNKFESLPTNQYGLLTITTINNDVMPLVRFKTKQYTRMLDASSLDINSFKVNSIEAMFEDVLFMIEGVVDYSLITKDNETQIIIYCLNDIFFTNNQIKEEILKHFYFENLNVVIQMIDDMKI